MPRKVKARMANLEDSSPAAGNQHDPNKTSRRRYPSPLNPGPKKG
jgi:hypothetical protein